MVRPAAKQVNFKLPNEDGKAKEHESADDDSEDESSDDESDEESGDEEEKKVNAEVDNEDDDEDDSSGSDEDEDDDSSADDETPKKALDIIRGKNVLLMDSSLDGRYENEDTTKLVELASKCLQSEAKDGSDTKFLLSAVTPLQKQEDGFTTKPET